MPDTLQRAKAPAAMATYPTLLAHLELGQPNTALLRLAGELAVRFGADIVGIAACQPMQILYGDGSYYSGDIIEQDRGEIDREVVLAEAEFRAALGAHDSLAWRSVVTLEPLAEALAAEARCADLVITGPGPGPAVDGGRRVAMGAFILLAGRPVLLTPAAFDFGAASLDRVIVGWKDTRATRRAIADALPLLQSATHVTVAEVAAKDDVPAAVARVEDVARWLARHGIAAEALATPSTGNDAARLAAIADERGAGLLVAGAYGHSRVREWVFGGVTRDLLLGGGRCALLSH